MKVFGYSTLMVVLLAFSSVALSQSAASDTFQKQVEAVLASNEASVIEDLFALSKSSVSAAAIVLAETVKVAPRYVEELIQALASVYDVTQLQTILELAGRQLDSVSAFVNSLENTIKIFGCNSIESCEIRIHDVPSNIEMGQEDPPASDA